MFRIATLLSIISLAGVAGCAKPPSPEEIAKYTGGTTKVVVFGFCVPMDHLIKTAISRYKLTYVVNGKVAGSMLSCSHATFNVASDYWSSHFDRPSSLLGIPYKLPPMIFRPGKTQYLHMVPAGQGTYSARWVSKAEADQGIAAVKEIKQFF